MQRETEEEQQDDNKPFGNIFMNISQGDILSISFTNTQDEYSVDDDTHQYKRLKD